MKLKVKKIHSDAKLPTKSYGEAAAFDLYALDYIQEKGQPLQIRTGLKLQIPKGYYGQILPKSGLFLNKAFKPFIGVIDSDYRGEITIIIDNEGGLFSGESNLGKKIAQIAIIPVPEMEIEEVEELNETERGEKGFGSSGA